MSPATAAQFRRLLAPLHDAAIDALAAIACPRKWRKGEVLISTGDANSCVLLITSGRVRVAAITPEGDERVMSWLQPGEMAGLYSVLGQSPSSFEYSAAEACEVTHFERAAFLRILHDDAAAAMWAASIVARRADTVSRLYAMQSSLSLGGRVYQALLRFAEDQVGPHVSGDIALCVSQADLAHAVGASRQRVNTELRKLEESHRIRLGYRHVVLLGAGPSDNFPPEARR